MDQLTDRSPRNNGLSETKSDTGVPGPEILTHKPLLSTDIVIQECPRHVKGVSDL